jgi:alkylation response protein AidB-like acyl-CoA dehydrogenase
VLNGQKHWITGGVSKLHLIFARVLDQGGREQGIAGFIFVRDDADAAEGSARSGR